MAPYKQALYLIAFVLSPLVAHAESTTIIPFMEGSCAVILGDVQINPRKDCTYNKDVEPKTATCHGMLVRDEGRRTVRIRGTSRHLRSGRLPPNRLSVMRTQDELELVSCDLSGTITWFGCSSTRLKFLEHQLVLPGRPVSYSAACGYCKGNDCYDVHGTFSLGPLISRKKNSVLNTIRDENLNN